VKGTEVRPRDSRHADAESPAFAASFVTVDRGTAEYERRDSAEIIFLFSTARRWRSGPRRAHADVTVVVFEVVVVVG